MLTAILCCITRLTDEEIKAQIKFIEVVQWWHSRRGGRAGVPLLLGLQQPDCEQAKWQLRTLVMKEETEWVSQDVPPFPDQGWLKYWTVRCWGVGFKPRAGLVQSSWHHPLGPPGWPGPPPVKLGVAGEACTPVAVPGGARSLGASLIGPCGFLMSQCYSNSPHQLNSGHPGCWVWICPRQFLGICLLGFLGNASKHSSQYI